MDWSTSYQAGSSSSASRSCTDDDETEDEHVHQSRGRTYSSKVSNKGSNNTLTKRRSRPSTHAYSSGDSSGSKTVHQRGHLPRSRSPDTPKSSVARLIPTPSPTSSHFARYKPPLPVATYQNLLPANLHMSVRFPYTQRECIWFADTRKASETMLLLGSILFTTRQISSRTDTVHGRSPIFWVSSELYLLSAASLLYILWTHTTLSAKPTTPTPYTEHSGTLAPPANIKTDVKDGKRPQSSYKKNDFGFIWMSVPKNYRTSSDDGVCTGLVLGPLIAAALLYCSLTQAQSPASTVPALLSPVWGVEVLAILQNSHQAGSALQDLVLSRFNLLNLSTFCSAILLFHICASEWLEVRSGTEGRKAEGERASVPRSEGLRSCYYVLFTIGVALGSICIKFAFTLTSIGIWQNLTYFDMIVSSFFYQFTLYVALRLAHRGFTLGELGLVCFGGTALFMELLNLTIARIWPVTTVFVKTYRLPTPLLVLQIALVAGSFLTGFLLSPFLVLSRHVAQRPVRRLKYPAEKQRHRRYLALGFYLGTVLIVGGMIGLWTRWCLGKKDPWLWVIFWLLEGRNQWSRLSLLAYWASLGSLSVAGWSRQLARSRRYRSANSAAESLNVASAFYSTVTLPSTEQSAPTPLPGSSSGMAFPNLPNGANVSVAATDFLNAAEKQFPTLGINGKRKFFHALTVVMFIPGIALDPAFTHLSFSVAFALFVFAEYVRYFAIYPFGAAVHVFMNEFLDSKDSGTAILSHFYLLTGCAGSLWLESPSQLLLFTGILSVGVGDALASVVGKRMGRYRWSSTTFKTIEGTVVYAASIVACAWILRLFGLAESFSTVRYTLAIIASALLEALSAQNDNLTVPLYMWSMLVVTR